mmetsp:Transcript_6214/g.20915  ORF Transcript_6214/g.20915 Transcript_6214/m.20915 type:complete len:154 (+) Transcript_6214:43-504(+)
MERRLATRWWDAAAVARQGRGGHGCCSSSLAHPPRGEAGLEAVPSWLCSVLRPRSWQRAQEHTGVRAGTAAASSDDPGAGGAPAATICEVRISSQNRRTATCFTVPRHGREEAGHDPAQKRVPSLPTPKTLWGNKRRVLIRGRLPSAGWGGAW